MKTMSQAVREQEMANVQNGQPTGNGYQQNANQSPGQVEFQSQPQVGFQPQQQVRFQPQPQPAYQMQPQNGYRPSMPYGGAQFGRREYVGGAMPGMSGIQPVRPAYVLPQVTVPNAMVGPRPPNISKAQGKPTATGGGESRGGQQQAGQQKKGQLTTLVIVIV